MPITSLRIISITTYDIWPSSTLSACILKSQIISVFILQNLGENRSHVSCCFCKLWKGAQLLINNCRHPVVPPATFILGTLFTFTKVTVSLLFLQIQQFSLWFVYGDNLITSSFYCVFFIVQKLHLCLEPGKPTSLNISYVMVENNGRQQWQYNFTWQVS